MQRLFSLSLIALICLSVYVIRSGHAGTSLQSAYTGPTPADCFSYPTELAKTHWACDAVLAVADIEDLHRAEALFFKGLAENEFGDKEIAVELYGQALALNPERRSAYYNRGRIHYYAKRYELAAQDALHVRDHWPERNDDWYDNQTIVFRALTRLKRYGDALEATTEYLAGRPDDVWGLRWRAPLLRANDTGIPWIKANVMALKDISKAISLEPGRAKDHDIRSKIFADLGVLGMAASEKLKSIQLRKKLLLTAGASLEPSELRSIAREREAALRRLSAVRNHLDTIPEKPVTVEDMKDRGMTLLYLGDVDQALVHLEELVELTPDEFGTRALNVIFDIREIFEEFDIASVVN